MFVIRICINLQFFLLLDFFGYSRINYSTMKFSVICYLYYFFPRMNFAFAMFFNNWLFYSTVDFFFFRYLDPLTEWKMLCFQRIWVTILGILILRFCLHAHCSAHQDGDWEIFCFGYDIIHYDFPKKWFTSTICCPYTWTYISCQECSL